LLRQQQRNEIMKNLFRFVNTFFALPLESCRPTEPPVSAAAFAFRTSTPLNCEGGES
jgi:hypothetical protein